MILNTNSLPFPLSPGLRAIILQHIADSFMACVLCFRRRDSSPDNAESQPVEIAVDTDGSLIHISAFGPAGATPDHTLVPETQFDFSRREAHYLDTIVPLDREHERFQEWEHGFVAGCRLGRYQVEVVPLFELEEIVAAD